jgi:uncharacterized protein (TIGR03067 family)
MPQRFLLTAFGLTLLVPLPGSAAAPSGLEGTWIEILPERPVVGVSVSRDPTTLVIAGNSFVEKEYGRTVRQSLFRVVSGHSPKAMDLMTVVEGEFWLTRAIYKVEGDMLTICECGRDKPRPSTFHGGEGDGQELTLLRTFKRQVAVPPQGSR